MRQKVERLVVRRSTLTKMAAGLGVLCLAMAPHAQAPMAPAERPDFGDWMSLLRQEALSRGVTPATIEQALAFEEPLAVVVERDRTQAETILTVDQYVERRLTRTFVTNARRRAITHRSLLRSVSQAYQVGSRYLVAIWGLESNFGRFSGVRPTVHALATLAWDGRRATLFRNELFAALEILDRGYIDHHRLKGSWAGAMGQTQFMPSSYLKYAEDFDGDGHRDIWASQGDVFASIANYLKQHGWQDGHTWGREVSLPDGGWSRMSGAVGLRDTGCRALREMTVALPLEQWHTLGVRAADKGVLPRVDRTGSLVSTGRRTFLVYGNYESLLQYNCAHAYALSVGLLADRIGG
ncbi:MAG: lytic murein transglycosylase [Acidobacteria bacterium]|nr:lytic murein transglycosylase [Acidobacteriota bacterium]